VERPQRQGQLGRRTRQRRDRPGPAASNAAGRGLVSSGAGAEQGARRHLRQSDHASRPPRLCRDMVRFSGDRAHHLCLGRAQAVDARDATAMMALTTLANGLRVASRPMQSVETVAVGLYAPTGSRYESEPLNGIAHLFEHMVFKGAGGRSAREISELVEDVGGDLNASTDRELTAFYASLLAPDLGLGVRLLADLIRRPHFEPHHLELEKKVVLQELAESRDTASDIVFDNLQEAAFPGEPLGRPVLGRERTIGAITVDDLHDWCGSQYAPQGLVLVGAGKLEHDQ